jgi:peptide/nickel transport system permease protein
VIRPSRTHRYPLAVVGLRRVVWGAITLWVVSVIVFLATEALPGNAARAVLGQTATPARLHALEHQLGLDRNLLSQYGHWLGGLLRGHLGTSLASRTSVSSLVSDRLVNSAALVVLAGVLSSVIGIGLGVYAARHRDSGLDHGLSVVSLAVTSLPEFVVGLGLVIVFSTVVFHVLPGVSQLPPGATAWGQPRLLVLPVLTLVLVTVPYVFRMTRSSMIEALTSEYVELAELKGLSPARVLVAHALPNALAPTIQVVALNLLYLAGGIVLVENVFNFPGIGEALVNAVSDRDLPVVQFIVLVLGAFYVGVNIVSDLLTLAVTPRRRTSL